MKKIILLGLFIVLLSSFSFALEIKQEQLSGVNPNNPLMYNSDYERISGSFLANDTYTLSQVELFFDITGSPTFTYNVEIYLSDGSGLPTGSVLASSGTYGVTGLTDGWYNHTLTTNLTISNSTRYVITLNRLTGTASTSNYISWEFDDTLSQAIGHSPSTPAWVVGDSTAEALYKLWGENITGTNFQITVNSFWDGSSITNFSADINGTIYNTSNGTIITDIIKNSTSLYNITVYSTDWFNTTYENYNVSTNLQAKLKQSQISFNCLEKISENTLDCVNNTIYPDVGSYNFSLEISGYYPIIQSFNVTALQNKTLNATEIYSTKLTITAEDYWGNTINNFTVNVSSNNYSWSETQSTTNGTLTVGLINGSYNIEIDNEDYELKDVNITIENTTQSYQFVLFTTNSISFVFKDELTDAIIDTETINIELISEAYANNYTTSNGTLYVDVLSPTLYNMRYVGTTNYTLDRFYYFDLGNRTHTNLTLYMLEDAESENITITVYDQFNAFLEDAYISVLKYDLASNTYLTREIIKTNFGGQANFLGQLNTEYYKFLVEYPKGTIVKETSPSYLYTNSLILKVVLGETVGSGFENYMGLSYELTFNNATDSFRYTYSHSDGIIESACLYVYKQKITGNTLYDNSCSTSAASTILISVTPENGTTYLAKAYVTFDTEEDFVDSYTKTYDADKPFKNDNSGLIYVIIIELVIILMTVWNIALMIGFAPFGLILSSLLGLLDVSIGSLIGIQIIAIVIAVMISNKS